MATYSSETSGSLRTTLRYNLNDRNLHTHVFKINMYKVHDLELWIGEWFCRFLREIIGHCYFTAKWISWKVAYFQNWLFFLGCGTVCFSIFGDSYWLYLQGEMIAQWPLCSHFAFKVERVMISEKSAIQPTRLYQETGHTIVA
jgi:hypothetical protein